MAIEWREISTLIPYARNARTHSEAQIAEIAGSIREFGFTNPVLIDPKGGIIAGHGRVLAARQLEMEQIPTICLSGLSETQRRAYIIADNKLALNAGWDEALLRVELGDLRGMAFDLSVIGFGEAEQAALLGE
jgi:ParB-like chromosome segregation protein Spo0J